jgi:hypothetical protein
VDAVFQALMASSKVPEKDRAAVLGVLRQLRKKHPNVTPARLFQRARAHGALIPPARCNHGVTWGECVVCDASLGKRFYYTGGGTHVHSTPMCKALAEGQEKVRRRDGSPDVIDVVPMYGGDLEGCDPCKVCLLNQPKRVTVQGPSLSEARAKTGFVKLTSAKAPPNGTRVDWGGVSGPVVQRTPGGIHIAVGGTKLFIAWGELVRVRS